MAQSDYQQEEKLEILEKTRLLLDEIVADNECLTLKELAMDGRGLMELGIKPGKEMGRILNLLLERVLEQPELNEHETLVQLVHRILEDQN